MTMHDDRSNDDSDDRSNDDSDDHSNDDSDDHAGMTAHSSNCDAMRK